MKNDKHFEDRYPVHKPLKKKWAPLERGVEGYPGQTVARLWDIGDEEKKRLRKALCEASEPLELSRLAQLAQVPMNNVLQHQHVMLFVAHHLVEKTKQAELVTHKNALGHRVVAFRATEHGKELWHKGL